MLHSVAAFSFSTGLSEGLTSFSTVFNAVIDNPLMSGIILLSLGCSAAALVWGIFH